LAHGFAKDDCGKWAWDFALIFGYWLLPGLSEPKTAIGGQNLEICPDLD
jgi:hypothetical protein